MKNLIFWFFYSLSIICNSHAQVNDKELTGKWKFVKMERPGSIGFDLDNLMSSYKKFFKKQKQDAYQGVITTNDSLYINVLFEKLVNDVNRMFILFKANHHYETNGYSRSGNMTEKPETGTYFFSRKKNVIYTYRNGNKKFAGRLKIIFLDKTRLIMASGKSSKHAVFTCRKVNE